MTGRTRDRFTPEASPLLEAIVPAAEALDERGRECCTRAKQSNIPSAPIADVNTLYAPANRRRQLIAHTESLFGGRLCVSVGSLYTNRRRAWW
jgi:hypothetical protein